MGEFDQKFGVWGDRGIAPDVDGFALLGAWPGLDYYRPLLVRGGLWLSFVLFGVTSADRGRTGSRALRLFPHRGRCL